MKKEVDIENIFKKIEKNKLSLPKLDSFLGNGNLATLIRRLYLEKKLGINLSSIASTILDFDEIASRNIENSIGAIQIPLAVVGPLSINGDYASGEFYIPLATTRKAVVSGINRGCEAITLSGGARVKIIKNYIVRHTLLKTKNLAEAIKIDEWIKKNFELLKDAAERIIQHGKLKEIRSFIAGNIIWLKHVYLVEDIINENSLTKGINEICETLKKNLDNIKCITFDENLHDSFKGSSYLDEFHSKGKYVIAEALIKDDILEKVLKTSPEKIYYNKLAENLIDNNIAICSINYNIRFADIITSMYMATGQDLLRAIRSSIGCTRIEIREESSLYISVTLPNLEVEVIEKNIELPTQREALSLIGITEENPHINASKFAEIVASTVLAGELNSLATVRLSAHERLNSH